MIYELREDEDGVTVLYREEKPLLTLPVVVLGAGFLPAMIGTEVLFWAERVARGELSIPELKRRLGRKE